MYHNITVKKVTDTEVEISGEVQSEHFESYRARALSNLQKNLEMPGFRKGHVPEKVLLERLGEGPVLEEMAEMALQDAYPKIIEGEKLDPIDRPRIAITKLAKGNPLGFQIRQSVIPEITLPDYKALAKETREKLAKESKPLETTDEEVMKVADEIAKSQKIEKLDDENVKQLGKFENLEGLKKTLRESISTEKQAREQEKLRVAILEAILEKTQIAVPPVLTERQMDRYIADTRGRVEQYGGEWQKYLEHIKKDEATLREESRNDAEKHVKTRLLLEAIGKAEKVEPMPADVDREVSAIMEQYPKTDPHTASEYVRSQLVNAAVLSLLEKAGA